MRNPERTPDDTRPFVSIGSFGSWLLAFLAVILLGLLLNWFKWMWLPETRGFWLEVGIGLMAFSPLGIRALLVWRRGRTQTKREPRAK